MYITRGIVEKKRKLFKLYMAALGFVRCLYCDKCLSLGSQNPNTMATLDHLIPKSKGGTNNSANLAFSCFSCNQTKGSKAPSAAILLKHSRLSLQVLVSAKSKVPRVGFVLRSAGARAYLALRRPSPSGVAVFVGSSIPLSLTHHKNYSPTRRTSTREHQWLSRFGWNQWLD
jgi:hypothetical protein